jgi:cell wall-associated NlpC family hydrolase
VRLRQIGTFVTTVILFGVIAASADARTGHAQSGGAQAPIGTTGGTGDTGSSGTTGATDTTGSTGTTDSTGTTGTGVLPATPLAPIVLPKGESPTSVYAGPVYELTSAGLVPYTPPAQTQAPDAVAGGTTATAASTDAIAALPQLEVPGNTAEEIQIDGLGIAAAPEGAPPAIQQIIWTANEIIGRPYVWGGGHRSFRSFGYDCSGLVSFALHGAGLLTSPLDSGQLMHWGGPGQGQWMTILTNPGHVYLDIAGLRLDTSPADDPSGLEGSHWRPLRPANVGYVKRHPFAL